MFKIRTIRPYDKSSLDRLLGENPELIDLGKDLFKSSAQFLLPHNFRFSPSYHLATDGSNVLGFVSLESASKANNSWHINQVFVDAHYRNEGIGEELLKICTLCLWRVWN